MSKENKNLLVLQVMEFSDDIPAWKWMKLWQTYSEMSVSRLKEIRAGFRLAEKSNKKRGFSNQVKG